MAPDLELVTRPDVEEVLLVPADDDGKEDEGEDTEEDEVEEEDDEVDAEEEEEIDESDSDSFTDSGLVSWGEIIEGVLSVTLIWLYEFLSSG